MPDQEPIPQKLSFKEKHPGLAELSPEVLPRSIGLTLGAESDVFAYDKAIDSAISLAADYAHSPIKTIMVFTDALFESNTNHQAEGYLPNFLEGRLPRRMDLLRNFGVRVKVFSDPQRFNSRATKSIENVEKETGPNMGINLFFVLDPGEGIERPDLLLKSDDTKESVLGKIVGENTTVFPLKASLGETSAHEIESAILQGANSRTPETNS